MVFKKCTSEYAHLESLDINSFTNKLSLSEDFENLPAWITSKINPRKEIKQKLSAQGVNLKSAIAIPFPPGNLTKSLLEDCTKVWFIAIKDGSSETLLIPGIWNDDTPIVINNRWRSTGKLGVKTLAELATKVAYIDLTDPANNVRALQRDRRNLAHGIKDIDRDVARKHAQYPAKRNVVYAKNPDGYNDYDHVLSYDIEWITHRGYDKSGYPLNPDKYVKLLNEVGLNNYSIRLERLYSQLEAIQLDLSTLMTQFSLENSTKYRTSGFSRSIFNDIGSAIRDFADLVSNYQRLKTDIDRIINNKENLSEEDMNDHIKFTFQYDGSRLSSSIRDLQKVIKGLKNPTPIDEID